METNNKKTLQVLIDELEHLRALDNYPNDRLEIVETYLLRRVELLLPKQWQLTFGLFDSIVGDDDKGSII